MDDWQPRTPGVRAAAREAVPTAGPNTLALNSQLAGSLFDEPAPGPSYAVEDRYPIGGVVEGADVNDDIGEALDAYMDAQDPRKVAQLGVAMLTPLELFGDGTEPGLCEEIEIDWDFTDGDTDLEGRLGLWTYSFFTSPIVPATWDFSKQTACRDALLAARGDVAAAIETGACNTGHELSFMKEGTDCRACVVEEEGDFAACVAADRCEDRQQAVDAVLYRTWNDELVWFDVFQTSIAACAPGYTVLSYLYANEKDDDTVPDAFDHSQWAHMCNPFWNEDYDQVVFYCSGETLPTYYDDEVRIQGVLGATRYIREEGTDGAPWADRRYFAKEIDFRNGLSIYEGWAGNPGGGVVSGPPYYRDTNGDGVVGLGDENWGQGYIGLGLHPYTLRPDGTDASNLDDTFARDWVAAAVLKTSTHTNGVPVQFSNHNRCEEWEDHGDVSRCARMGDPDPGWLNDAANWWIDPEYERPYIHSLATLASTGLPDPAVPGGVVVGVASSSTFADADFEACDGYPHRFEPDLVQIPDVPDRYDVPASLTVETYRFGKEPPADMGGDIRAIVNTNWVRFHCPTDGDSE